jgi:prepilin-type N-terminal cleavage/methylation domain-containing protein
MPDQVYTSMPRSGFTLIEMSIVLVIIGLVVGGILTGKDLIDAASQRAQVTQVERYNTAVNTFRVKYGNLPGDIPDPQASQFGFQARGTQRAQGDGNGIIEGYGSTADFYGGAESAGETTVFWVDLSTAGLIDGGFNSASTTVISGLITGSANLSKYFPNAKIGNGTYVYVWSGGLGSNSGTGDGNNYFGVSGIINVDSGTAASMNTSTTLTVQQAYNIDKKVDDGFPQSGSITALYDNYAVPYTGQIGWAAGGGNFGASSGFPNYGPTAAATPYATTNCYDNNNVAGVQQTYSLSQNANQQNCALSFKFQ